MNIGYSINYCSKLLKNRLNKELEKEDITVAQFAVIKYIEMNSSKDQFDTGVTSAEVAEGLDMDKPTISGIINRLVDKSYIEKTPHSRDKRASLLRLTEYCIGKLSDFETINNMVIRSAVKGISDDNLDNLEDLVSKIIKNLK